MSIAKIVVPLTGAARDAVALATAFIAAKPHNAHVIALFVSPDPRLAMPYMGAPLSPEIVQAVIDSAAEVGKNASKAARAALADAARAAGVEIVAKLQKSPAVTCSFREVTGFFPQCIQDASRFADLTVFGPVSLADGPDLAEAFASTLLKTERPVLLASQVPESLTGKIAFAWDGSAVAAHALVSAIAFLETASSIALLTCCHAGTKPAEFQVVEEYLALHGLACERDVVDPGRRGVADALLDTAIGAGADLLVMGGYGHSPMGEAILGGVTQHIRWHPALPVLMVH